MRSAVCLLALAGCSYPEFGFIAEDAEADTQLDSASDSGSVVDSALDAVDASVPEADVLTPDAGSDACPVGQTFCDMTCVDLQTNRNHCGKCGLACGRGEPCTASVCTPEASCAKIHARFPAEASNSFMIDPDGTGPLTPFRVFCEMSGDGGGWTLALKLDGKKTTFAYDAAIWTDDTLLNTSSADITSFVEAKFRSYLELPFTGVRVRMVDAGTARFFALDLAGTSLKALFAGPNVTTTAGRVKWVSLVADPSLQANCDVEGVNLEFNSGGPKIRMRLGIAANNEITCTSPDSWLGFGASISLPGVCYGGVDPLVVVGNAASTACAAPKDKATQTFGFLYVR